MEQDDIKFYRQLVKDAATENERLQNACKSYEAQANRDALEIECLRREETVLRELLTMYNLGGWMDSERLIKERDRLRRELSGAQNMILNYQLEGRDGSGIDRLRRELAEARELLVEWRGLRGVPVILASLTDTWLAAMAEQTEVPK